MLGFTVLCLLMCCFAVSVNDYSVLYLDITKTTIPVDRVPIPLTIAIDILIVCNGEGLLSPVPLNRFSSNKKQQKIH